jgi:hypothetical protein
MDPRPMRTMADMGMGSMEHDSGMNGSSMPGMGHDAMQGMKHGSMQDVPMDHSSMPGMQTNHGPMQGMSTGHDSMPGMSGMEASPEAKKLEGSVGVDNVAMMPTEHLQSAGEGFPPGRRVLAYADLRAPRPGSDPRPPASPMIKGT